MSKQILRYVTNHKIQQKIKWINDSWRTFRLVQDKTFIIKRTVLKTNRRDVIKHDNEKTLVGEPCINWNSRDSEIFIDSWRQNKNNERFEWFEMLS